MNSTTSISDPLPTIEQPVTYQSSAQYKSHLDTIKQFIPNFSIALTVQTYAGNAWNPLLNGCYRITTGHQIGCDGIFADWKTKQIAEFLRKNAKDGITFKPENIPLVMSKGTCTSMSCEWLDRYLENPIQNPVSFAVSTQNSFAESSLAFRTTQAAFNCLELVAGSSPVSTDTSCQNKMQSILSFYGRVISAASEMIDFQQNLEETIWNAFYQALQEGAYIIRAIRPAANTKGEEEGHTLALIKSSQSDVFYDPNFGSFQFSQNQASHLYFFLNWSKELFNIPSVRFYQIDPISKTAPYESTSQTTQVSGFSLDAFDEEIIPVVDG